MKNQESAMPSCIHQPLNLYELNTRLWLRELGVDRLRAVPDAVLDELAGLGFDALWLMGVWTPSAASARLAARPELLAGYRIDLPDCEPEDIEASPYAIAGYRLSPQLGSPEDLLHLRGRLHLRGMRLILDFVPNHTAVDHPFTVHQPQIYAAPAPKAAPHPDDIFVTEGGVTLYHGRDPNFPSWIDTAQVDYRRRDTWDAMIRELRAVAACCDGVRCDMAMLLLRDVFAGTWTHSGRSPAPPPSDAASGEFWAEAIDAVRARHPGFLFIAESYWGLERRLQHLGFDFTYDKALYDHLLHGEAWAINSHLGVGRGRQRRSVRFIENHDEPRAAALAEDHHQMAALLALTLPGMRLLHQGQLEGARRRVPVQLRRRAAAPIDPPQPRLRAFYQRLLALLADPVLRNGDWRLLPALPTWEGNPTHQSFVLYGWDGSHVRQPAPVGGAPGHRLLAANLAQHPAQCHVRLALPGLAGREVIIEEMLGTGQTPVGDARSAQGLPSYRRHGDTLAERGLFLDLPARSAQLLAVHPAPRL